MSVKNHSDLTDDITNDITSNGNQEITGLILQGVLNDMADSAVNKLGDTVQGKLAYSSLFSISSTGDLTHKSYVDGAISTAIAAIPIDASPTDGSSNAVSSDGVFDSLATKLNLSGGTMTGNLVFQDAGEGITFDEGFLRGIGALNLQLNASNDLTIHCNSGNILITSNMVLSALTASRVLELDASKNIISAAKGTAYNKSFGTSSGTVTEGNDSRITGALQTTSFTDAAVTGKVLTGYISGAGVVAATDSILQAVQKLNGNIASITPPVTTKGDIFVYGSAINRLPVGTDGQVLLADSAQALGLKWGTATGGSGGTESGTGFRIGSGSTFNGTTRITLTGLNATGGVSDCTIHGYNCKSGSANLKVILFGSNLNSAATAANSLYLFGTDMAVTASSLIGIGKTINLQATGIVAMLPNSGNVTYTITGAGAVVIGDLISLGTSIGNSVLIGKSVSAPDNQTNMVIIGNGAKGYLDATYGSSGSGHVAIGENTFAGSWRATAIGSYSQALAVSSTAHGYGSYVNAAHGSVYGRGGYNPLGSSTVFYNGTSGFDFYFGGVGSTWTNPAMPGTETPDLSAGLNAGTTITKLYGIPGKDYKPVSTLTNTKGGHLQLTGGPSTGTAIGGEVRIVTTPAGGSSNNTLNTEVICASFDAVAIGGSEQTRFMLLDLSTGTLKRVSFGANDSGGTGYKYLRVAN